jgi:uncharacterized protein YgbK (DUF1537 family)
VLPAGGADLFREFLHVLGHASKTPSPINVPPGKMLIACGSATDYSRQLAEQWHHQGFPVCPMPEWFNEEACAKAWARTAHAHLHGPKARAILTIRHAISPDRAFAFRCCMAETVRQLVAKLTGDLTLVVEGGATAAAVAETFHWTAFGVEGTLAPGVVALRPLTGATKDSRFRMILKPGSYPWPADFPHPRTSG